MTDTRRRVREHVASNPGVHFNDLVRALDLAPGQVQYHVRRLERRDAVVADPRYGRTHYFEPAYDEWERGAIALLRRETARAVVVHLLDTGPSPAGDVAAAVGVARSTLSYQVDRLVEADVLERRRPDGSRVRLATTRPRATAALLVAVDPSLADRLVDRFTRLVDAVLSTER